METISPLNDDFSKGSTASSSEDEFSSTFDILSNGLYVPNQEIVISHTKKQCYDITDDTKKNCKIMKFDSDWKLDEISNELRTIHPRMYQNLFMFTFNVGSFKRKCKTNGKTVSKKNSKLKNLMKILLNFAKNRPLILQIRSTTCNVTRIFFKDVMSNKLSKIRIEDADEGDFYDFPSFIAAFMNAKNEKFANLVCEKLPNVKNSEMILRFLRIFALSENTFEKLVLKCAEHGTINDLIAVIDSVSFYSTKQIDSKAYKYIKRRLDCKKFSQNEQEDEFSVATNESTNSAILMALRNSNAQNFNFLVDNCSNILQELPIDCQLATSDEAFEKNSHMLCDLLDICDFPFPSNKTITDLSNANNQRLNRIMQERENFHNAITNENYIEIVKYIRKHPNLKTVFNSNNDSAAYRAAGSKNFKIFCDLKSRGFKAPDFDFKELITDPEEKKLINSYIWTQRRKNVKEALPNEQRTILLLSSRSCIHNKGISKATQAEYQKRIRKWYEGIHKIEDVSSVLDTSAQCFDLKIVFDFESETTESIDVSDGSATGQMYPKSKWIFIGAKTWDDKNEERDREIRGIIAHEMSHYAMRLNYENKENPYYMGDTEAEMLFTQVVDEINSWHNWSENDEWLDDECDGIISSAFIDYSPENYHPELIVRIPQILAKYDGDAEKLAQLEQKYKPLFDYHREKVVPDLEKFNLKERQDVRKFNSFSEQLAITKDCNYEFSSIKDTSRFTSNHITVVETNIPSLLLLNIYKYFLTKFKNLLDAKSIFVSAKKLKNNHILTILKDVLRNSSDLNVIVDCSTGFDENFKSLSEFTKHCFTFIVTDNIFLNKAAEYFENFKSESVHYTWNDVSTETQSKLLQNNTIFLQNSIPLYKLMFRNHHNSSKNRKDLIKDNLFKLLVEKSEVKIEEGITHNENENKYFNLLFRQRKFNKFIKNKLGESNKNTSETLVNSGQYEQYEKVKAEMTQVELLKDIKNQKYVLISDLAGTGKSWVIKNMKNVTHKNYPEIWTSYIDLKQFIRNFKAYKGSAKVVFVDFMVKNLFKFNNKYEEDIFRKMYENGKVCIFFDGFDEIAPDCTEIVMKLIKSFEKNDGNQLWIATRDYFQIDLLEVLNLDVVYKLEPFSQEDGINLITISSILNELESENKLNSEDENIETLIKSHPKYEAYQKKAHELNQLICGLNNKSIGFPQFYQMIAHIYRNKEAKPSELTIYKIFEEFVKIHYERWSMQKGELRIDANILSQLWDLNYVKLHQYFAMKGSYPQLNEFCDLTFNDEEWTEEEIIACGLLAKRNDQFQFQHETFREFFIAQFLLKILEKGLKFANEEFYGFLRDVITIPKFGVVRMFLNDAMNENKISVKFKRIIPNMDKFDFIFDICRNNLERLQDMWMSYYQSLNYYNLRNIIFNDIEPFLNIAKDETLCAKFKNLPYALLESYDLYELMQHKNEKGETFIHLIVLKNSFECIKDIVEYLKERLSIDQFDNILKSNGQYGRNLLQTAASASKHTSIHEYLWNLILDTCRSRKQWMKILNKTDDFTANVFITASANASKETFKYMIEKSEENLIKEDMKKVLSNLGHYNMNIFQTAAKHNKSIEFHEYLWKLLHNYFDRDEILGMIQHVDKNQDNILHHAVKGDTVEIVKFIWNNIKIITESFTDEADKSSSLKEILKLKEHNERNLLQNIICNSKNKKVHEFIWELFYDLYKTSENFIELLEADYLGGNTFYLAACFATLEIFNFMIENVERFTSKKRVNTLLINIGSNKQNLLQGALYQNRSAEFYKNLWKILCRYLNSIELLEMAKYVDGDSRNILDVAIYTGKKDITKVVWNEVKDVLFYMSFSIDNLFHLIQRCHTFISIVLSDFNDAKARTELKITWLELLNVTTKFSKNIEPQDYIQNIAKNNSIAFHKKLWSVMWKSSYSEENLVNFLLKTNSKNNNYLHIVVIFNNKNIIEFTIDKCKEILSDKKFSEVMKSKGQNGRNLLQLAACGCNERKTHEYLWKIFKNLWKSSQEFLEFLKETDNDGNNILNLASFSSTIKIFKYIIEELENFKANENIKKMLRNTGYDKRNLLQAAIIQNKSLEFHTYLWKIMNKYFCPYELLDMVVFMNNDGNDVFNVAIHKKILNQIILIWNEIQKVLNSIVLNSSILANVVDDFAGQVMTIIDNFDDSTLKESLLEKWNKLVERIKLEILMQKSNKIINQEIPVKSIDVLHEIVMNNSIEFHEKLWSVLENSFEDNDELVELLVARNNNSENYLHLLVEQNVHKIVEFTVNKYKQVFSKDKCHKILTSKGQFNENLLQSAIYHLKDFDTLKLLWINVQYSCNDSTEFIEFITETDKSGFNTIHTIVGFTSDDYFEFIIQDCEKYFTCEQIKQLLSTTGYFKENLLQCAITKNSSQKYQRILWTVIQKYFDASEILEMIEHTDEDGDNILHDAIYWNEKEICELTWAYIKGYITNQKDQIEYLMKRGHGKQTYLEISKENQLERSLVMIWVENLMIEYKISDITENT